MENTIGRLLKDHNLSENTLLYREAERASLTSTTVAGVFQLAANAQPSESVIDVYGQGYLVQAEEVGAGLAFAESASPNWQETMELRTLQLGKNAPGMDNVEVTVRLGDLLKQGGRIYPVESVTVEKAWYFTLPTGSVEVTIVS